MHGSMEGAIRSADHAARKSFEDSESARKV